MELIKKNIENSGNPKFQFTGVHVFSRDLVYLKGIIKKLDKEEVNHSFILKWENGNWGQYMIPNIAISHCVIKEEGRKVLALGPDGVIHVAVPNGFSWEHIDPSKEGPNSLRNLIEIKEIGGKVYSVGMARMIYKREPGGIWQRFDNGVRTPKDPLVIAGLKSIDGIGEDLIYAVGFKGEIWKFNGDIWDNVASPTNLKLEKIICISKEKAFACGGKGTLLEGSSHGWSVVSHEATTQTIWGLDYFLGNLYFADNRNIYKFNGEIVEKIDLGVERITTTSYLHSNDGVLWSVGEKDIFVFDGSSWSEISFNP